MVWQAGVKSEGKSLDWKSERQVKSSNSSESLVKSM